MTYFLGRHGIFMLLNYFLFVWCWRIILWVRPFIFWWKI